MTQCLRLWPNSSRRFKSANWAILNGPWAGLREWSCISVSPILPICESGFFFSADVITPRGAQVQHLVSSRGACHSTLLANALR